MIPDGEGISRRHFLQTTSAALVAAAVWPDVALHAGSRGSFELSNGVVTAQFDSRGLIRLGNEHSSQSVSFTDDGFSVNLGEVTIDSANLPNPKVTTGKNTVSYLYSATNFEITVCYELQPKWQFVSKQLSLAATGAPKFHAQAVIPLRITLADIITGELTNRGGSYGAFVRFASAKAADHGMFFVVQNPFMEWARDAAGQQVSVSYKPEMDYDGDWGPFITDRVCFGPYALSGFGFPAEQVPEWQFGAVPGSSVANSPTCDMAEWQALTDCVRAFVIAPPLESARIHVGWCENDYQIDITTPHGQDEYHRIINQVSDFDGRHILYGPTNPTLATRDQSGDAWQWEYITWLGLGVQIREGKWNPNTDPVPPSITAIQEYARERDVSLIAYVYPSVNWRPEWTAGSGPYAGANTATREFQDWFVQLLVDFYNKTGIAGYSFDYWWLAYPQSSAYEQWNGCRWILETLRDRIPDILIDGRQSYQNYGPWTWLAGTYPHPTTGDEQPESFPAFPDLHIDRVYGNRQRWAAYWYRMENFCPTELLPGFMTHQTQRYDSSGAFVPLGDFRIRDWDYLGWKYSVLSSIATAPMNNVVNMLPARDLEEFRAFSGADQQWLRDWLDWTDKNMAVLGHLRPIISQPIIGSVDGTAAIDDDHGFVFVFNPNARAMDAVFTLDSTIGLASGTSFTLRTLYPRPGILLGNPTAGVWRYGDKVTLPLEGGSAMALEITEGDPETPALLNCVGQATLDGDTVRLTAVQGAIGHRVAMQVLLPKKARVSQVTINGAVNSFNRVGELLTTEAQFAGLRFDQCSQVGVYDPMFSGGEWSGTFTIPARIFDQLQRRKLAWPVSYTPDDLAATWLGSARLLLYVQVADPSDSMPLTMHLNGREVELQKAYSSIYPQNTSQTFVGWYLDVGDMLPDIVHTVHLSLPTLKPGQFQGAFFENVETEMTTSLSNA